MNLDQYHAALAYTAQLHRTQMRKGSEIPYITHLMSTSSLVIEYGGDQDQAIAGLLHDAIEDQAESRGGVAALSAEISQRFGPEVLRIVMACTDAVTTPKPPWRARKEAYIAHLRKLDARAALVSSADKLHNARSILADFRREGDAVFERFTASKAKTLWYYSELAGVFLDHFPGPLSDEVWRTVESLRHEAGDLRDGRERLELYNGKGRTTEWAYYQMDQRSRQLIVEAYDYGPAAEAFNGRDLTLQVKLDQKGQEALAKSLADEPTTLPLTGPTPLARLHRLKLRFPRYHEFKAFVEANNIPHEAEFDPFA